MPKLRILGLLLSLTFAGACNGSSDSSDSALPVRTSPTPILDSETVPPDLRHLIQLAQHWGVGDDVERSALVNAATPAQRARPQRAVAPHQARITQWLDSFGQGTMTHAATTFMYMQLAIEEMVGRQ